MVEFFNTGIDTEYLIIFIVIITFIISITLSLTIYHFQKIRPKIKIETISVNNFTDPDSIPINILVVNIGFIVIENLKCKITTYSNVVFTPLNIDSEYLMVTKTYRPYGKLSLKMGKTCKIKVEISWDNHTFLLKKRNKQTRKFILNRTAHTRVSITSPK